MSDQRSEHLDSRLMLADDALLQQAASWQGAGHKLALAFVIQTWGSSPRQVGSLMLVRDDARIAGSVSGGCVEGAVIDAALEMIEAAVASGWILALPMRPHGRSVCHAVGRFPFLSWRFLKLDSLQRYLTMQQNLWRNVWRLGFVFRLPVAARTRPNHYRQKAN